MAFTAADVKTLREMTGVGMMDCKKALTESDGDMDKAVEYLREKGLAASRRRLAASPPRVWPMPPWSNGVGVVVEVNCETDFVGKNEKFVDFVKGVAAAVAANKPADLDALMACKYLGTDLTVPRAAGDGLSSARTSRSAASPALPTDISVPYVHAGGKIGVLVNLDCPTAAVDATESARTWPCRSPR